MHSVSDDLLVSVGGHVHQLSTACLAPVGLASCIFFGESAKRVGSHACTQ